jgi:hypothetical protein
LLVSVEDEAEEQQGGHFLAKLVASVKMMLAMDTEMAYLKS